MTDLPRGIRNNNPGNLDYIPEIGWAGMTGPEILPDGSQGRFARFDTAQNGIRALTTNLLAYQDRHGLRTVRGMIYRWAPPGENDSDAYVRFVADHVHADLPEGQRADAPTDMHDPPTVFRFVRAVIAQENGNYAYPDDVLSAGIAAAGIGAHVAMHVGPVGGFPDAPEAATEPTADDLNAAELAAIPKDSA